MNMIPFIGENTSSLNKIRNLSNFVVYRYTTVLCCFANLHRQVLNNTPTSLAKLSNLVTEKCFLQLKQKENGYFRASIICTHKLRSALGKLRNWLLTTTFLEASKPFNKISSLCRNELFYSNFNVFFD
ncbi:hypothetical protein GLOIN_2v1605068 [Rhizophagus irregularis DAOM 181602=DAOM 197198]|nr:hypothetical protein GLOIN_2v1605068 [Rhizophagus irregularis DAOM 181602=DAOM 197198]